MLLRWIDSFAFVTYVEKNQARSLEYVNKISTANPNGSCFFDGVIGGVK